MFLASLKNWGKSFLSTKNVHEKTFTGSFSPVVYRLESPRYHLFDLNGDNWVTGWVFYFGEKVVSELAVTADEAFVGNFPVNVPRPDIGMHVPFIPAAQTCGFHFKLPVQSHGIDNICLEIIYVDGTRAAFLKYDVDNVRQLASKLTGYQRQLQFIPVPSAELVFLTQGHDQTDEYQQGIIPAVLMMQSYLQKSGVDVGQIGNLLDFGCGSGRLLVGWHVIMPHLQLYGCDLNLQLVEWSQHHLPQEIDCRLSNLNPPLPYEDQQFDMIYLISVFTHLSLETQKLWIQEFKRILRRGGYLMVTLHGELYVRNAFGHLSEYFSTFSHVGYVEEGHASVEGGNRYRSFHRYDFACDLFADFDIKGYFPNGNDPQHNTLFQIAQSQDVYVLQYTGK